MTLRTGVFSLLAAVTVVGACNLAFNWGKDYKPESSSNPVSNVSISNDTVKGNIIDDLSAKDPYEKVAKTIGRHKTNGRVVYFTTDFNFLSVKNAVERLKELESKSSAPIYLLIDSPGGSVLDGATLISQIEASKAPVYTVCTRLCASMAAMTHSYGAKRLATDRALLMFHPASGGAQGQIPNMVSMLKSITRYVDKMSANIVGRSRLSRQEYESLVAYEIWIDSEDSLKKGLVDEIVSLDVANRPSGFSPNSDEGHEEKVTTPHKINFELISPYAKDLW